MEEQDLVFSFQIKNKILSILYKNELIYISNINRIIKDMIGDSIELFVFYEICEYNPQLGYYQYDFCKSFLKFAKEINR